LSRILARLAVFWMADISDYHGYSYVTSFT
jgi:hypothetical protein